MVAACAWRRCTACSVIALARAASTQGLTAGAAAVPCTSVLPSPLASLGTSVTLSVDPSTDGQTAAHNFFDPSTDGQTAAHNFFDPSTDGHSAAHNCFVIHLQADEQQHITSL
jgi:hypothetical protein